MQLIITVVLRFFSLISDAKLSDETWSASLTTVIDEHNPFKRFSLQQQTCNVFRNVP